jgi:hypothetical protein
MMFRMRKDGLPQAAMHYRTVSVRSWVIACWLALLAMAGAACSPAQTPLPAPAGAVQGQLTFIYYYTDN